VIRVSGRDQRPDPHADPAPVRSLSPVAGRWLLVAGCWFLSLIADPAGCLLLLFAAAEARRGVPA
jgi:hypothetical protein